MASSPESQEHSKPGDPSTEACWERIRQMDTKLMRGESFSGHEANCAYLNTGEGTGSWASVGFLSGFDFDDDARAVAVTDWDGDGDLDVWIANRTAPRVRYLRNDMPKAGDWISLQLRGVKGHGDAIGARVTVTLAGQEKRPLVRELRAGEGFLTQSSKWLHFGLGEKARIASVKVRWRAGAEETFENVTPGDRFTLRETLGRAEPGKKAHEKILPLLPAPVPVPSQAFPTAVRLAFPIPLPPLPFTDLSGAKKRLDMSHPKPRFITLWSPDDDGAAAVLAELNRIQSANPEALDVVALASEDTPEARQMAKSAGKGISIGFLTSQSMARLERLGSTCFEMILALKTPQAWLVTPEGKIVSWYRTPPAKERLAEDVSALRGPVEALLNTHLPFPGSWHAEPKLFQPLEIAAYLQDSQQDAPSAAEYLLNNKVEFRKSIRYAGTCRHVANALKDPAHQAIKVALYKESLLSTRFDADTSDLLATNLLLLQPLTDENKADALIYALRAAEGSGGTNANHLATKALAQAARNQPQEAQTTAQKALEVAQKSGDKTLESALRLRLGDLLKN